MRCRSDTAVVWLTIALLAGMGILCPADAAEPDLGPGSPRRAWRGAYGSSGTAQHLWSVKQYTGYENQRVGVFEERETGEWVRSSIPLQWSMRYELRYERLFGSVHLVPDQVVREKRTGGPYVRDLDGLWQVALLWVPRLVAFPDSPVRPSVHAGLGLSWMNEKILEDGTYYNFNILAGCGIESDLSAQWALLIDCRWEHYSNGGCMYLTDKTAIGLESVNGMIGVRREF